MKQLVTVIAIALLSLSLSAQHLDFMGFPSNENFDKFIQHNTTRDAQDIESVVIVNSFPSPVNYTSDVAFDGELLWVTGYAEYQIFGLNPETGEVMETIAIDFIRPYGMTYSDGSLFIINNNSKEIVEIDRNSGDVLNTTSILQDETYPTGLELINGVFWFNDPRGPYPSTENDLTVKFDPVANTFTDYTAVGEFPSAISFDGDFIWSIDNVTQIIHKVDKDNLESVQSFQAPGGSYPNGLTFDGEFMWISNNDSDSIYQISLESQGTATNIDNKTAENNLSIYPTIANEVLNVDYRDLRSDVREVEFFNMQGQVVGKIADINSSDRVLKWEIPEDLSNGVYICNIQSANENISKKFFIKK